MRRSRKICSMTPSTQSPDTPTPDRQPLMKSGFVAVVGRPNAGKSTLINALVGAKVSIVTPVPQTTRNRILGIANRPTAQVIFMDTPGIHKPLSRLNQQMMSFVRQALQDRDLTILIVDASQKFGRGDQYALDLLREYASRSILALNKIDTMSKTRLLPLIECYSKLHNLRRSSPFRPSAVTAWKICCRRLSSCCPKDQRTFLLRLILINRSVSWRAN